METIRIKFDYPHGAIWKELFDFDTEQWSTGIPVIDNDKALTVLDDAVASVYSSVYSFDANGNPQFDYKRYENKKPELHSLVETIVLRLGKINDGSYIVHDEETRNLL